MNQYMVIGISPLGTRCIQVDKPEVPEGWVHLGEVAFVVQVLDIAARHSHEAGADHGLLWTR